MPRRRQRDYTLLYFLGASLLVHLLLLLIFAVWLLFTPEPDLSDPAPKMALELTLAPPPSAKAEPDKPGRERFVNASESTPVEKPVESTPFIGSQNTLAASETNNTTNLNTPKQEGVQLPGLTLDQSEYAREMERKQATQAAEAKPSEQVPEPKEKPEKTEVQTAESSPPPPSNTDTLPLRAEGTLYTSDKPSEKGKEKGEEPAKSPETGTTGPRSPPTEFSAASPYRRKTQLDGGAAQNGEASIAIRETELGRYKQKLFNAIGSRWHLMVQKNGSMLEIGIVRVRFTITADGRIKNLQVIQGEQLSTLMRVSRQSIFDLDQPWEPFSPTMRQQIGDEYTEEVSFTIY